MKDTINESQFVDEMSKKQHGFSYDGAKALFEHLTQYEEDCDKELEFDPIAFRCEYSEYDNLAEFQEDYSEDYQTIGDIESDTTVIMIDDESFIIQQF